MRFAGCVRWNVSFVGTCRRLYHRSLTQRHHFDIPISLYRSFSNTIFSTESKISTSQIKQHLEPKSSGEKQWEIRKRLEYKEKELKKLRQLCNTLLEGKDEFVVGAISVEGRLRERIARVRGLVGQILEGKATAEQQWKEEQSKTSTLQQQIQYLRQERDQYKAKSDTLQMEYGNTKYDYQQLQQTHTQTCIKLGVLQSQVDETNKQAEAARRNASNAESTIADAVKEAEARMAVSLGEDMKRLQKENASLRNMMKGREEELCKVLDIDASVCIHSESMKDEESTEVLLDCTKQKMEEWRVVERTLEDCRGELERAKADYDVSTYCVSCALSRCCIGNASVFIGNMFLTTLFAIIYHYVRLSLNEWLPKTRT